MNGSLFAFKKATKGLFFILVYIEFHGSKNLQIIPLIFLMLYDCDQTFWTGVLKWRDVDYKFMRFWVKSSENFLFYKIF